MSESTPNLYSFATKELAQDATLAYVLAWADPSHRESNPVLHQLGKALLTALLASYRGTNIPEATSVVIEPQKYRIDILVRINDQNNDRWLLLIEDKVRTHEHSNQIERYVETAQRKNPDCTVVPVFVKTGNTSQHYLPFRKQCGRFLRGDLLRVLREFPSTGNTIVDNFREHLEGRERDTLKYRDSAPSEWKGPQIEGFYCDLERQMEAALIPKWDYVHNQRGGFRWFAFRGDEFLREGRKRLLYPQIEDGRRLTVRIGWGGDRIRTPLKSAVLRELENAAHEAQTFKVRKTGRAGGTTAAVAVVEFKGGGYLALTADGRVDMKATVARLEQVAEVLPQVADALSTAE